MARIYDKYREIDIEVPAKQAEIMAKHRPDRYVLPTEVEEEVNENDEIDNSEVDATRGAINLADEHGIDLKELYTGERINKSDVQNYLDEQH